MLAGGLLLRNWTVGRHSESVAGFLSGMSLVFLTAGLVKPSHARRRRIFAEMSAYLVAIKVFTTMAFGCTPTGINVSREYSLGSSLRGLRF